MEAGIENLELASEILSMIVALKSNESIYRELVDRYGTTCLFPSCKRKFNTLLQSYIIHNYFDEFMRFCRRNSISVFNEDLEVDRKNASSARMVFIVFLREEVRLHSRRIDVKRMAPGVHYRVSGGQAHGHV